MKLWIFVAFAAAWFAVAGQAAHAAGCVNDYAVNFPIVNPVNTSFVATVSGDICTDGTIGTLGQSDISSWNLSLSNSWNPLVSDYSLSSSTDTATLFLQGIGSPLSATSTDLSWNYFDPGDGNYAILDFAGASNFIDLDDYHVGSIMIVSPEYGTFTSASIGTTQSGPTIIGELVPEPASLAVLGVGALALTAARRRRARA